MPKHFVFWLAVFGALSNSESMHMNQDYLNDSELNSNMLPTAASTGHPIYGPDREEPFFVSLVTPNVTAVMGRLAQLTCRVRKLKSHSVSWIRHRDLHILTTGTYTYTSDQRFQTIQQSEDWILNIKWVQLRDAGMYECQVSTQPIISYFVYLNVVVPVAKILGGPDLHVGRGSTINLTCLMGYSPEAPAYVFWYHNEEKISYDSPRGGVSVIVDKSDSTTSCLLIRDASPKDSGNYSCSPSNADVASVRVHVLNGERPEAMQTGTSKNVSSLLQLLLIASAVLVYSSFYFG